MEIEKNVLLQSVKVSDTCIKEGNMELETLTKRKVINRDKLIAAQSKISMGLKRKAELSKELEVLEKKLKK